MKESNNILKIAPLLYRQLLIFVGFVCVIYLLPSLFKPSVESQMEKWDAKTIQDLHSSLDIQTQGRELSKEKEERVLEQIGALIDVLDWRLRKMQFYTRISEDLYVPVDLRIDVEGNSKELFFLLEGISRLDAFSRLEELSIESKEVDIMKLRFRFFRPYFPSGDWIEERTDFSDKKKAVLKQGWLLWCWKSYRRQEQKWMNKEARRRQDFLLQLSAHLSEYRFHKQDIHWDIKKGFKEKIRQELR